MNSCMRSANAHPRLDSSATRVLSISLRFSERVVELSHNSSSKLNISAAIGLSRSNGYAPSSAALLFSAPQPTMISHGIAPIRNSPYKYIALLLLPLLPLGLGVYLSVG